MQRFHDDVVVTLLRDTVPEGTEEMYLMNARKTPEMPRRAEKKGKSFDDGSNMMSFSKVLNTAMP